MTGVQQKKDENKSRANGFSIGKYVYFVWLSVLL